MQIELREVQVAEFASQETCCFEAAVVIDGERAGTVKNGGTGGCNVYQPNALRERLREHAKTLKPFEFDGIELQHDADSVVAIALDAYEAGERLRRRGLVIE